MFRYKVFNNNQEFKCECIVWKVCFTFHSFEHNIYSVTWKKGGQTYVCYDHLSLLTTLPSMLSSWHFLKKNCWQKHGITFNILTNIFILKLIWQTFIIYNLEEQLILSMSNFDSFMLWHIGHKIRQTPCQVSGLAGNENIDLLDWVLSNPV